MTTKYLASDPAIGSDANTGDSEQYPWLTLQTSIDKMANARKDPADPCVLMIMNYQVDQYAVLQGPKYANFQFIGAIKPVVKPDPHKDVLFCEPRPRMRSPDPGKPIFRIDQADDITIQDLVLFQSHRAVHASDAKNVAIVRCCIHHNTAKRGGGFLLEKCAAPLVDTCRVWQNQATDNDGGAGAFDRCEGVTARKSFYFLNSAKQAGGALSFVDCTHEIAIDENDFGDLKIDRNSADSGGAVAALRCEKLAFGLASGRNTYKWNTASGHGGALSLELCRNVVIRRDWYSDNDGARAGGAIISAGTDLTVHEAEVQHNEARYGGGIRAETAVDAQRQSVAGTLALHGTLLRKNIASTHGGGVSTYGVPLTIADSRFYDENKAIAGGGLHFESHGVEDVEVRHTTFTENRAMQGGGAYFEGPKVATIVDCTFEQNRAGSGGGLQYEGPIKSNDRLDLENCRFEENQAMWAAGAEVNDALAGTIQGNGFHDNQAGSSPTGIMFGTCKLRALGFKNNEFTSKLKIADIRDWHDRSTPPMSGSEIANANPTAGVVPGVETN
jgi:hypothetical protein